METTQAMMDRLTSTTRIPSLAILDRLSRLHWPIKKEWPARSTLLTTMDIELGRTERLVFLI